VDQVAHRAARHGDTDVAKRLTVRDEDLMRKDMGERGLPNRRKPGA
jgi:hypothetical protein